MTDEETREDVVEEARWRVETGYYDLPDVLEDAAARLLDALRNAAHSRSTNSGSSSRDP